MVLRRRGPSSETLGLLGRVYKDRWQRVRTTDPLLARGLLDQAIEAYLQGFEADWRDSYPGVNAVTLMELRDPPDPRRLAVLPVVRYANQRRLQSGQSDYWDHATRLELDVIVYDENDADDTLGQTLAAAREPWQPASTLNNLRLLGAERTRRGDAHPSWTRQLEAALEQRANTLR